MTHVNIFSTTPFDVIVAEDVLLQPDVHHPPLSFSVPSKSMIRSTSFATVLNLRKCDQEAASETLFASDLGSVLQRTDICESFSELIDLLGNISIQHSPLKYVGQPVFTKWFSRDLICLVIDKKKAHEGFKATLSSTDYFDSLICGEDAAN